MSASTIDEGPTSGTTRTPRACASATRTRPDRPPRARRPRRAGRGRVRQGRVPAARAPRPVRYARKAPPSRSPASGGDARTPRGTGAPTSRPPPRRRRSRAAARARAPAARRRAARPRRATPAAGRGVRSCSRNRDAFRAKDGGEGGERQAHERRGIVGGEALEKRDPQALAPGAARAIERRLALEVAFDLRGRERGGTRLRSSPCARGSAAPRSTQSAVWKSTVRPESSASWRRAFSSVPGLPIGAPAQVGDLIRADNPGLRETRGAGPGLGEREAGGGGARDLARQRVLVDIGRPGLEGEAQAREQLAPVGRARCQYN